MEGNIIEYSVQLKKLERYLIAEMLLVQVKML